MNLKEACEKIADVEQAFDVNAITYRNASLWPVIRICAWYALTTPGPTLSRLLLGWGYLFFKAATSLLRRQVSVEQFSGKAEIILLTQPVTYTEHVGTRRYDRLLDPFYEWLSPRFRVMKVDKDYGQNNYIPAKPLKLTSPGASHYLAALGTVLTNWRKLSVVSRDFGIPRRIFALKVLNAMSYVYSAYQVFGRVLDRVRPEAVFVNCYYAYETMGAIAACRERGVKTIDVQHGKQGRFQGAYNHWTVIPEAGYVYLPDIFWVWGKESMQNIMAHSPTRSRHTCIVGGYPWLSRFQQSSSFDQVPEWFLRNIENRKVILVSLQAKTGAIDSVIPEALVNAIKASPKEWLWLLRRHPNHMYVKPELLAALHNVQTQNYLIEGLNDIPLYGILKRSVHHVTAYSSVVYEAEAFGVNSSLFGEDALLLYQGEIRSGRFNWFSSADDLMGQIASSIQGDAPEWRGSRYIESNETLFEGAIQTIMHSANGYPESSRS
jgi:hypothetical protein